MWTFTLWPGKTWNESVEEVGFGIWKAPGYLRTKLMVIDKQGNVLIRPNHENKLSCKFNMPRLLVAFTLHNLSMEDVNDYGLHVEFGLTQNPLTDTVMLRLQGNIHFRLKYLLAVFTLEDGKPIQTDNSSAELSRRITLLMSFPSLSEFVM